MEKVKSKALTFDDVLLLPRYSDFVPSEAVTETKLTKNITIKTPLISAAMDTVTESKMGIALAEAGGLGVIHKNNSIEEQAQLVKAVKKYDDYPSMNIKKVLNKLVKEKYIVTHVNSKNKEITYSIPEKIDNDNLKKKIKKKKNSESSLIIEE